MMPSRSAGFVLVNALVLVAAMAAAATLLLSRAEGGRARLAAFQQAEALGTALDAFENLARVLLDSDLSKGPVDALDDVWTRTTNDVPLALGRVSGRIVDQQSLFNLNWLSDTTDTRTAEGFAALLTRIGVPPQKGDAIARYLSPSGPSNRDAFPGLRPPIAPLGGSILYLDQLASLPEVTAQDLDLLRPHVSVLPGKSQINVNTASAGLLLAMLPEMPDASVNTVLRRRLTDPYTDVESFFEEAGLSDDPEAEDFIDPALFSVGSNWFGVSISATLDTRTAARQVLLRRESLQTGTQVEWRVSRFQ